MPIRLFPHAPAWMRQAGSLIADLSSLLGGSAGRFEHVGSTSVPGLAAKAKLHVDILLAPNADVQAVRHRLQLRGYTDLGTLHRQDEWQLTRPEGKRFGAGLPEEAGTIMAHRVCLCRPDSPAAEDRRRFRDALLENDGLARDYERLKRRLAASFGKADDWENYNSGKTAFIDSVLSAKEPAES